MVYSGAACFVSNFKETKAYRNTSAVPLFFIRNSPDAPQVPSHLNSVTGVPVCIYFLTRILSSHSMAIFNYRS